VKKFAVFLTLGVLGFVPAAIAFGDGAPDSSQQCKAEQNDANFAAGHGGKTFAQFYGANANQQNAFGKCVSSKAKASSTSSTTTATTTTTTTTHVSPAAACRTERATDPAAFKTKYGKNHNQKNAFGKCVSAKAKAQSASD
jgi:hypothetical protein